MSKTKISEFSSDPANNTDIDGINIAEGCAPSGINNAIRELMAQLKDWQSGTSLDTFNTNYMVATAVDINGGAIDGAVIGANSAAAATFTTATATTFNATTVDSTNIEVTNIKAKDGTAAGSIADSTGVVTLASSVLTTTDINGGTIDGTTIGASSASTGAFTTLSASSTVTLSGGTANGVLYLNGSKVATSGSALTFDGTHLSVSGRVAAATGSFNGAQEPTSGSSVEITYVSSTGFITSYNRTASAWTDLSIRGGNNTYFSVNGSEQMRLTSTGLGIGTSSPSTKLQVVTTINTTYSSSNTLAGGVIGYIRNASTTNSTDATLRFDALGAANVAAASISGVHTGDGASALTFGTRTNAASDVAERLRIDSSGNLGLGVTPSAWYSGWKALEIGSGTAIWRVSGQDFRMSSNLYNDGSNSIYKANGAAAFYTQGSGAHTWFTAPSGTAGNAITFSQVMTVDSAGNWMVGATSALGRATIVQGASSNADTLILKSPNASGAGSQPGIQFLRDTDAALAKFFADTNSGALITEVAGTERMRIDTSGYLLLGHTNSAALSGKPAGVIAPIGYVGRSGTGGSFANVFNIYWTGSAELWIDSTNIGNIQVSSDYRIKRNIQTQTQTALNRITQLRPVVYQRADFGTLFKADDEMREGFIAHELAEVIPSAVQGEKDAENQIQSLNLDALCSVMVKAIQEQQAIIESLKSRLDAAGL